MRTLSNSLYLVSACQTSVPNILLKNIGYWRKNMKAIVCTKYGSADVLELQDVETPVHKDKENSG